MSEIIQGDCLDVMKSFPDNHFSGIVTDPPYSLGFMGKAWDATLPSLNTWQEALRICKPGGHLLSFGAPRTYHRLTCSVEDAGWEIRDCLCWLYGSGFPKSLNISKAIDKACGAKREIVGRYTRPDGTQRINAEKTRHNWASSGFACHDISLPATDSAKHWEGYGTALKPAYEPIILAMKPLDGTFAQNAEKWGIGGLNIDGCRIAGNWSRSTPHRDDIRGGNFMKDKGKRIEWEPQSSHTKGRWPANLLLDEKVAEQLGPPSRFFYCPKTSSRERNEGLDGTKNAHPTVKPLALMRYLITLISPPTNALILDPFAGSGSTIVAAHQLGIVAIGIEKQPEYCEIARARLMASVDKVKKVAELDLL